MFPFLLGCVYRAAMPTRATPRDGPHMPSGPNLLDEPLKGFIVNRADLPWKWVKRLATSGERVNHDSQSGPVWNEGIQNAGIEKKRRNKV